MALKDKLMTLEDFKAVRDVDVASNQTQFSAINESLDDVKADLGTLTQDAYKAFPTDTASGAVASFEDGADDIPLKSLVIDINPVQGGSGDPSPTNVRPITGWTGANVARTGKNLFDYDESKVSVGVSPTGAFRSYYPTGITNCTVTFSAYLIDSSSVTSSFVNIGKLVNGKLNVINSFLSTNGDITNRSVTFAEGEEAVLITAVSETSGITSNLPKYNIQLELGSTATAYEPYAGQSYPISWQTEAGTVYGGMLDVLTGVLTVNKATIDLGTLTWRYNVAQETQKAGFYTDARLPNAVLNTPLGTTGDILCSIYKTASYAEVYSTLYDVDKAISIRTNGGLRVVDSAYSDATIFKTAMSGVILVYPLAESVVYQLTPQEVSSLLDINNIWADTGNANVEYRADTVLYADKVTKKSDNSAMIAPVESSYTATRNYTVNQLLIVDNVLYKVTANIANGGTITPNTNVVATTLSEVILALA